MAEIMVEPPPSFKREREEEERLCAFCHDGADSDDPDDDDPLIEVSAGRPKQTFSHENCLYWCPELTQAEDMSWQNVGSALRRCHRLKCAGCGEGDAPLGCKRAACKKNWHYPCAMTAVEKGELVIYEDEYCVACIICHELLVRRKRKMKMEAERKKAEKAAKKAMAAAVAAAAKPAPPTKIAAPATAAATSSKTPLPVKPPATKKAAAASSKGGPPATGRPSFVSPATGGGRKQPSAQQPRLDAAPAPPKCVRPPAAPTPVALPAPPAAPLPPPPPCPEGFTPSEAAAAEKAISQLFSSQRCEDLPLETVRSATGLPQAKLDSLIAFMDDENKLMCRAGVVYLI